VTGRFKDHFSDRAADYAVYRPHYPSALADYLTSLAPLPRVAWDVGCGSGQFSTLLGERFEQVIATDASAEQIARAVTHPHVTYAVAPADRTDIAASSVDLITVAQAAHWFDLPRFYDEVHRVARPGAAIAMFAYGITIVDPPVGAVVDDFYWRVLDGWWPRERRHTENGYRDLDFPFEEIEAPQIEMAVDWAVDHFLGYVGTWSGVRALTAAKGDTLFRTFSMQVREAWSSAPSRRVSWPLRMRVGAVR
jgi:SAM-dependent methyltransferase